MLIMLSKITEKIVFLQLINHIETTNLMYDYQSAYRYI